MISPYKKKVSTFIPKFQPNVYLSVEREENEVLTFSPAVLGSVGLRIIQSKIRLANLLNFLGKSLEFTHLLKTNILPTYNMFKFSSPLTNTKCKIDS